MLLFYSLVYLLARIVCGMYADVNGKKRIAVTQTLRFGKDKSLERKVNADDLRGATNLGKLPNQQTTWFVCDRYELRDGLLVSEYPLFHEGSHIDQEKWRSYQPLEDTPDLFLKFARLGEENDFESAALSWSHRYGLPSATSMTRDEYPKLPLSVFKADIKRAHHILAMYEAGQNDDEAASRKLIPEYYDEALEHKPYLKNTLAWFSSDSQTALLLAAYLVERTVQESCHPAIKTKAIGRGEYNDLEIESIWHIEGLLGAMYLQMFWLVTSGSELLRCKYCGRLLSLARPTPEGRKRRSDKKFCNDACRQAHHREKKNVQLIIEG